MKSNEAPKKIYLYPDDRAGYEYDAEWGTFPWGEDCVEYTRTDAFIKKACELLAPVFKDLAGYYSGAELLDDFKKHMKGE